MIKLVAFDWNGTMLSDTICCWEAANKEYEACGAKGISMLTFRQTFDIPYLETMVKNGANRNFIKKNSAKIAKVFHDYYEPRAARCRTRSGVREVLAHLKKHGIRSMIFSNHTVTGIEAQLKRLNIRQHMDIVLAHEKMEGAVHTRNKGQRLNEYTKKHKYKPKEVIVVGDTEEEMQIGKEHGFYTVGLTGGYHTTSRLKKHHPDYLIHNMKALVGIVKKLNKR